MLSFTDFLGFTWLIIVWHIVKNVLRFLLISGIGKYVNQQTEKLKNNFIKGDKNERYKKSNTSNG